MKRREFGRKRLDQQLSEALHGRFEEIEIERFVVASILAVMSGRPWPKRERSIIARYFARYGIQLRGSELADVIAKHFEDHPINPALADEALAIIVRDKNTPRGSKIDAARSLIGASEHSYRPRDPKSSRTNIHQVRTQLVCKNDS